MKHELTRRASVSTRERLLPAIVLFVLSPLVGEFLLGNLSITMLWILPMIALLYGCGAVIIRETARRLQLGWPSMIVLALAYAIIEEAFVTQSLFNPNFLGLRLLEYGFMPDFEISIWWTVYVLGIHVIWSIGVPIALTESLVPDIRRTPWLSPVEFTILVFIFLLYSTASFVNTSLNSSFMASNAHLLTSAGIVVILIAIALLLGRVDMNRYSSPIQLPSIRAVGMIAFLLGSVFMSLSIVHDAIPASLNTGGMISVVLIGGLLFLWWSKQPGWSVYHSWAVPSGLVLTYAWYGFYQIPSEGDASWLVDIAGNALFAGCTVILLVIAKKRVNRTVES